MKLIAALTLILFACTSTTSPTGHPEPTASTTPSAASSGMGAQLDLRVYDDLALALADSGVRCPEGPSGGCTDCMPLGDLLLRSGDLWRERAPSGRAFGAPGGPSLGRGRTTILRSKLGPLGSKVSNRGPDCGPGGGCQNCRPPTAADVRLMFEGMTETEVKGLLSE